MRAWISVLMHGLVKIPLKIIAPVGYFFIKDKVNHPIFGVRDAEDLSWYNIAIRNGCHNFFNKPGVQYWERTNTPEDTTLEMLDGFQWRYRKSLNGKYVSFRCTWGAPRQSKGKREFYIGWTLGQTNLKGEERMRLTFFQFRPF